ncbi:MAG: hypothetical protein L3J33_11535 [Rhodobacteraceae bacterium]|nr:hypothetical protein [Paracoccaceae bacterium]
MFKSMRETSIIPNIYTIYKGKKSMQNQYFVVQDLKETAKGTRFIGQFVVDGTVAAPAESETRSSSSGKKKKPKIKIKIPKLRKLKWILPAKGGDETAYNASKDFAEGAGYETVEHDDFTYPER